MYSSTIILTKAEGSHKDQNNLTYWIIVIGLTSKNKIKYQWIFLSEVLILRTILM